MRKECSFRSRHEPVSPQGLLGSHSSIWKHKPNSLLPETSISKSSGGPRTLRNLCLPLQIESHGRKWRWRIKQAEAAKGNIALCFHSEEFAVSLQTKVHQKQEGQSHRRKVTWGEYSILFSRRVWKQNCLWTLEKHCAHSYFLACWKQHKASWLSSLSGTIFAYTLEWETSNHILSMQKHIISA